MFWHVDGYITCCGCLLEEEEDPKFSTFVDAMEHLYNHRKAGYTIPSTAFDGLEADRRQYGDTVPEDHWEKSKK